MKKPICNKKENSFQNYYIDVIYGSLFQLIKMEMKEEKRKKRFDSREKWPFILPDGM